MKHAVSKFSLLAHALWLSTQLLLRNAMQGVAGVLWSSYIGVELAEDGALEAGMSAGA